jgi:ATP-dependent Clp protease ATP-binding subunit ClpC
MIGNLGESGKVVLAYARRIALNLDQGEITPAHLLLAVGDLDDLAIRQAAEKGGLNLDALCAALRRRLAGLPGPTGGPGQLGPAAEGVLDRAEELAARSGAAAVEAPHILAALVGLADGPVAETLEELGVDRAAVRESLTGLADSGDWTPSPWNKGRPNIEQVGLTRTADVLESLGRDLTEAAEKGDLNPTVGRKEEIARLTSILLGRRKNNAVLVGEAGVGKTAIVEGLAQQIVAGDIPALAGMRIRTIEVGSLVAGTIYRGQFEQRMKDLIDSLRGRDDVILFIDELHMLVGAGETGQGGSVDAANILKPVLSEGTLKVIGATTIDDYRKHLERESALMRRFQVVTVGEPSRDETVQILRGMRPTYEEFHLVRITDAAVGAAVDLSRRYVHDRFLPDKAFDLLDRACTQEKLDSGVRPGVESPGGRPVVDAEDVAEVLSLMVEIPVANLTYDERSRLSGLPAALKARVFAQDRAVEAVAAAIQRSRSGVEAPSNRPTGVFLFLGPTGVGKTKLAEELAAQLFGETDDVIRLDMAQYSSEHSKTELIGAGPGYVGWEEGGKLTNAVRRHPYSVVLLDEVEKAHPVIWNLFLGIFDRGRMSDGLGRTIDFRSTVIVMTANVGSRFFGERPLVGFAPAEADPRRRGDFSVVERRVLEELEHTFPPEFLNRVDEVVVFRALPVEAIHQIVQQQLADTVRFDLHFSKPAFAHLVEVSYNPAMGARPVRRAIQREVSNPLSRLVLAGQIAVGDAVSVGLAQGRLTFRKRAPARRRGKGLG